MKSQLIERLESKRAVIGVIGLGYVGLPLATRYAEAGYPVVGFDIDQSKVASLNAGKSYIGGITSERIAGIVADGFRATSAFENAQKMDALIICVPTPLGNHAEPDLSFVTGTIEALAPHLRPGQIVSLESTTYPGTTDEEIVPRVEALGLTVGKDIFVVFSPEREDPGNSHFTTQTIPKVCGGHTPACLDVGMALYGNVIDRVVPVSSTRAAEMTKLLENIHRAVNIGLANEMKVIAARMGIDIYEVIAAASTKPFGFVPYFPGPGLGGHCIPIDPFYLTWKAKEFGMHTRFIELAGEINRAMPDYVVSKIADALNQRRKSVNGSSVLVLGIAYKKNVDDMRESPSVVIMEKLQDLGADIAYCDPHVPTFPKMRHHRYFDLESVALSHDMLAGYDCVLVATDHDCFDYELVEHSSALIVDTRGRYRQASDKIVKA